MIAAEPEVPTGFGLPTGKQRRSILYSDARMNIWHGSVRSGKTVAADVRWLIYCKTAPKHLDPLLMFGKTERTVRRNVIEPMQKLLGAGVFKVNWGKGEGKLFGRNIHIVGANDERAVTKVQGGTYGGAYGDELTLAPESFTKMVMTRLSLPGSQGFFTTNPDNPMHYVKKSYLDRGERGEIDCKGFHFGLADNPFLSQTYVDNLLREYTGLWKLRYIDGQWVVAEGAVYDMLDPAVHEPQRQPQIIRWYLSIDYGTSAPFVALLIGHGRDEFGRDALYVMNEWRWDSSETHRQLTDKQYSVKLRQWIKKLRLAPAYVFCDPSATSFILQLTRDGVKGVIAADNTVDEGLRNVSSLLSDVRLYIHPRCKGLWAEMVGYVWDPKKQETGEDVPIEINDHGPDALRYAVRMLQPTWRPWIQEAA